MLSDIWIPHYQKTAFSNGKPVTVLTTAQKKRILLGFIIYILYQKVRDNRKNLIFIVFLRPWELLSVAWQLWGPLSSASGRVQPSWLLWSSLYAWPLWQRCKKIQRFNSSELRYNRVSLIRTPLITRILCPINKILPMLNFSELTLKFWLRNMPEWPDNDNLLYLTVSALGVGPLMSRSALETY